MGTRSLMIAVALGAGTLAMGCATTGEHKDEHRQVPTSQSAPTPDAIIHVRGVT